MSNIVVEEVIELGHHHGGLDLAGLRQAWRSIRHRVGSSLNPRRTMQLKGGCDRNGATQEAPPTGPWNAAPR